MFTLVGNKLTKQLSSIPIGTIKAACLIVSRKKIMEGKILDF
jgi:hypothetical protein